MTIVVINVCKNLHLFYKIFKCQNCQNCFYIFPCFLKQAHKKGYESGYSFNQLSENRRNV